MKCFVKYFAGIIAVLSIVFLLPSVAFAESIKIDLGGGDSVGQTGTALKMFVVLTVLSMAPAILMTTTSFIRIAVVLSFLRSALGTQSAPPQTVLMGMALFLTMAIMAPVANEFYADGVEPYLDGKIDAKTAFHKSVKPLRHFMLGQTREADLALFYDITKSAAPDGPEAVGIHLLIPAFITSELRTSFEMGFMLFIPFLLLDLVVASVTMALGLVMLPPAMISLPIKVMVFVLADGWNLLVRSLVMSFA